MKNNINKENEIEARNIQIINAIGKTMSKNNTAEVKFSTKNGANVKAENIVIMFIENGADKNPCFDVG